MDGLHFSGNALAIPLHDPSKRVDSCHHPSPYDAHEELFGNMLHMIFKFDECLICRSENKHIFTDNTAEGMSLGETNYMIKPLLDARWLKLGKFKRANNKMGYAYSLTRKA